MTKHATVRWDTEMHLLAQVSSGDRLEMDEEAGGHGFRPSELLMAALGGCTAMDVVSILRKKQQTITAYEVDVTGEQSTSHPKVYTDVVVEHRIQGDPLDPEAVRRAVELSATRYCTVTAVMATGVARIVHRYVVRNVDGEHRAEVIATGPHGSNVGVDEGL